MGLVSRIAPMEKRQAPPGQTSLLTNPASWLFTGLGANTFSGQSVSTDNAMTLTTVWSCINLLATSIGSISCRAFQETADDIIKITDSALWRIVHDAANYETPASVMWETTMAHLLLYGNAFLWKERDANGLVTGLWTQQPGSVRVGRFPDGRRLYELTINGQAFAGSSRDFLHLRSLGTDGVLGLSPISQTRQALGVQLAQQEYMGRFYANNAQPSGILSVKGQLSDDQSTKLAEQWQKAHSGLANAAKVAVLEEDTTWQALGLSLDDQQLIEQRRFNVQEVCRIFNVPPYMLGESSGDSLTYATSETSQQHFATTSVRPWAKKIESFIKFDGDLCMLPGSYVKFNLNELVRADLTTRMGAYETAVKGGWMRRSEVREAEDMPKIAGIDDPPAIPA